MWFGKLPTEQCAGCVLAHSLKAAGWRVSKGTVLDEVLISEFSARGFSDLLVARLETDDIEENLAAKTLAQSAAAQGVRTENAHTGRVNLYASCDGLLTYNSESIIAANSINEDITLSVLAQNQWVLSGRMIGSAKIIPYAVAAQDLQLAVRHLGDADFSVRRPIPRTAVLIQTVLSSVTQKTLDKTRTVTEQRLQSRASRLIDELRCDHTIESLTQTIQQALSHSPHMILIAGASAISDRRDVLPASIVQSNGNVDRVGLPIDPGNLLMLAEVNNIPVLGLPGCARSEKHNGLDLILDRMLCGVEVSDRWLNSLCIGGLLNELHDRPQPRVTSADVSEVARDDGYCAAVAALILAAGTSRRAGEKNKLLHPYRGNPMLCSVVESVIDSEVSGSLVVTGHESKSVEEVVAAYGIDTVFCVGHAKGMAHSIATGLSRLQSFDAVLVCLGDMPHVTSDVLNRIISAGEESVVEKIVVPVCDGRRGNPVMIGRTFFDWLLQNEGDSGARCLMQQYPERVVEIEIDSDSIFRDYDTEEALTELG